MAQSQQHRAPVPPPESEEEKRQRAQREEEEARAEAEAATAHLPRQGDPVQRPAPAAELFPDEATVSMNFPHPVTLTLSGFRMVYFPAGVQEVPESLVDEPYLADNGVSKVGKGRTP